MAWLPSVPSESHKFVHVPACAACSSLISMDIYGSIHLQVPRCMHITYMISLPSQPWCISCTCIDIDIDAAGVQGRNMHTLVLLCGSGPAWSVNSALNICWLSSYYIWAPQRWALIWCIACLACPRLAHYDRLVWYVCLACSMPLDPLDRIPWHWHKLIRMSCRSELKKCPGPLEEEELSFLARSCRSRW